MIEVEKRFQPTEEQLEKMLEGAEFLSEKVFSDIYYDYPDYRLFKKDVRLRKRTTSFSSFQLKINLSSGSDEEIENKTDIEKYFGIQDLEQFIKDDLMEFVSYETKRKEYKKGEIIIDLDELNFGYKVCEIEILVETEDQIKEAEEKLVDFAKEYNIKFMKGLTKRRAYLKLFKPEVYNELYGNK